MADEVLRGGVANAGAVVRRGEHVLRPSNPHTGSIHRFLTALHEVTMSVLLYGPGSETLAVVVLNSGELGQVGQTAALSVLLTALLLVPAGLCWWALRSLDLSRRAGRVR